MDAGGLGASVTTEHAASPHLGSHRPHGRSSPTSSSSEPLEVLEKRGPYLISPAPPPPLLSHTGKPDTVFALGISESRRVRDIGADNDNQGGKHTISCECIAMVIASVWGQGRLLGGGDLKIPPMRGHL